MNISKNLDTANRERGKARSKAWGEANQELVRARSKAWYEANRERALINIKAWREAHPEKVKEYERKWWKVHPEKSHALCKARRAMRNGSSVCDFTAAQWQEMQAAFDHRCAYCGKRAKGHLTQDHLTPLSKGGNHTLPNIVPACRSCNSKKYTGPPLKPVQPLLL